MLEVKTEKKTVYSIKLFEPKLASDEKNFLIELTKLVKIEGFILILEVYGEKGFSTEGKKQLGLWYRENKSILGQNCQAIFRVDPSSREKLSEASLQKAFPCPYYVTESKDKALSIIFDTFF
jgi:hypothetical protein